MILTYGFVSKNQSVSRLHSKNYRKKICCNLLIGEYMSKEQLITFHFESDLKNISAFTKLSLCALKFTDKCLNFFFYYWEYKLVQSVFLCIYFKTKWMNRSIKILSIAAYYFFPSLRQFSNSISKKWLFGGDPILEPIFDFCERSEPVICILRNNQ